MNICIINKLLITAFFSATLFPAAAQSAADSKKSGDYYFKTGDYYSAASYYQSYLDAADTKNGKFLPYTVSGVSNGNKKDDRAQVVYRMAESYRLYNDHIHAEKAYGELKDNPNFPDARYWYAISLRANARYDDAKQQLLQYLKDPKANYAASAKLQLEGIAFMEEQIRSKEATLFEVNRAEGTINSTESNFAGSKAGNNILFTSSRQGEGKNNNDAAVYLIDANGGMQKINWPQVKATHFGAATLSGNGNHLYVTGWTNDQNDHAAIYLSTKTENGWSSPVRLNAAINVEGYHSKQPFLSADGRHLLFASNRPGGLGGSDIWIAALSANGEPAEPFNAGTMINTTGDDEAPFYHEASKTLVFASNGRIGLGGFDLYQSSGSIGGPWSVVKNLGYPVNSNKDDLYFSAANEGKLFDKAFISSDRNSDYCMSIFEVSRQYKKYIAGHITDCNTQQRMPNATVSLDNAPTVVSNDNGSFIIEVKELQSGMLGITKQGYQEGSAAFSKPENALADTIYVAVCMKPVEAPKTSIPNQVYFEFAKYELTEQTKQFLDTLAAVMAREPKLKLIATGYTDKVGTNAFNQTLSEQRADAVKTYLVEKGIDALRIESAGKGDCCAVMPETKDGKDDPDARQLNRRVEFILKLIMQ